MNILLPRTECTFFYAINNKISNGNGLPRSKLISVDTKNRNVSSHFFPVGSHPKRQSSSSSSSCVFHSGGIYVRPCTRFITTIIIIRTYTYLLCMYTIILLLNVIILWSVLPCWFQRSGDVLFSIEGCYITWRSGLRGFDMPDKELWLNWPHEMALIWLPKTNVLLAHYLAVLYQKWHSATSWPRKRDD